MAVRFSLIDDAQCLPDDVLPSWLKAQLGVFLSSTEGEHEGWLEELEAGRPFAAPSTPPLALLEALQPIVCNYKAQKILFALAYEMPDGTSLRHALAFLIIALADHQGEAFTVSDLLARGDVDQQGKPIFTSSFRRAYLKLVEEKLVKSKQRDRHNDLTLTPKGRALMSRVTRRMDGGLLPDTEEEIDLLVAASKET